MYSQQDLKQQQNFQQQIYNNPSNLHLASAHSPSASMANPAPNASQQKNVDGFDSLPNQRSRFYYENRLNMQPKFIEGAAMPKMNPFVPIAKSANMDFLYDETNYSGQVGFLGTFFDQRTLRNEFERFILMKMADPTRIKSPDSDDNGAFLQLYANRFANFMASQSAAENHFNAVNNVPNNNDGGQISRNQNQNGEISQNKSGKIGQNVSSIDQNNNLKNDNRIDLTKPLKKTAKNDKKFNKKQFFDNFSENGEKWAENDPKMGSSVNKETFGHGEFNSRNKNRYNENRFNENRFNDNRNRQNYKNNEKRKNRFSNFKNDQNNEFFDKNDQNDQNNDENQGNFRRGRGRGRGRGFRGRGRGRGFYNKPNYGQNHSNYGQNQNQQKQEEKNYYQKQNDQFENAPSAESDGSNEIEEENTWGSAAVAEGINFGDDDNKKVDKKTNKKSTGKNKKKSENKKTKNGKKIENDVDFGANSGDDVNFGDENVDFGDDNGDEKFNSGQNCDKEKGYKNSDGKYDESNSGREKENSVDFGDDESVEVVKKKSSNESVVFE